MLTLTALAFLVVPQELSFRVATKNGEPLSHMVPSFSIVESASRAVLISGRARYMRGQGYKIQLDQYLFEISRQVRDNPLELWLHRDGSSHRLIRNRQDPWPGAAVHFLPDGIPNESADVGELVLGSAPLVLAGTARWQDGSPATSQQVRLYAERHSPRDSQYKRTWIGETRTDGDGRFSFRELLPPDARFDSLQIEIKDRGRVFRKSCQPGDFDVGVINPESGAIKIRYRNTLAQVQAVLELRTPDGELAYSAELPHGTRGAGFDFERSNVPIGEYETSLVLRSKHHSMFDHTIQLGKKTIVKGESLALLEGALNIAGELHACRIKLVDQDGDSIEPGLHPASLLLGEKSSNGTVRLGQIALIPEKGHYLLLAGAIPSQIRSKQPWSHATLHVRGFRSMNWDRPFTDTQVVVQPISLQAFEILDLPESDERNRPRWNLKITRLDQVHDRRNSIRLLTEALPHPQLILAAPGRYQLVWGRSWPDAYHRSRFTQEFVVEEGVQFDARPLHFPSELHSLEAREGKLWNPAPRRRVGDMVPPGSGAPARPSTPAVPLTPTPPPPPPPPQPAKGDGGEARAKA